jgi:opacity protein-like surface antigen
MSLARTTYRAALVTAALSCLGVASAAHADHGWRGEYRGGEHGYHYRDWDDRRGWGHRDRWVPPGHRWYRERWYPAPAWVSRDWCPPRERYYYPAPVYYGPPPRYYDDGEVAVTVRIPF